jgi:hypothetical protein
MTPEQISRTLLYMEQLRMDSYETETKAQERRLIAEYNRLWKSVKPFLDARSKPAYQPLEDHEP